MHLQNLFWRKIKHSTTKQSSFDSRGFTLWLSVGIFENGYNYSCSMVKTICPRYFDDMRFTGHQACTASRIPSVAINAHHLCSSTYHLRKSFLQIKTYFTSFYSHNTEKPFFRLVSTNQSNRHDTSSTSRDFFYFFLPHLPQNTRNKMNRLHLF